jgi:deoxyhypusine synthase
MSAKEDADSDASEVLNDGQEMSDSLNENDISIDESINQELINETSTEKTGYEASDIIEDALQLAVDDELKEEREVCLTFASNLIIGQICLF